jgi:predicted DNA-binding transcriptional regulator AlpA
MTSPGWPRMMRRATAAAYLDLSQAAFEREVIDGVVPMPVKLGGREHWCRVAIDAAMDRLTGDHVPDWRASSPLYNDAPPARRLPKRPPSRGTTPDEARAYLQAIIDNAIDAPRIGRKRHKSESPQ